MPRTIGCVVWKKLLVPIGLDHTTIPAGLNRVTTPTATVGGPAAVATHPVT